MLMASHSWGQSTLSGTRKGTRPWRDEWGRQRQKGHTCATKDFFIYTFKNTQWKEEWIWIIQPQSIFFYLPALRMRCPTAQLLWHYYLGYHELSPPQEVTESVPKEKKKRSCNNILYGEHLCVKANVLSSRFTFTWKTSSLLPTLNWDSNRMVNFSSVTDSAPRLSDRLILFKDCSVDTHVTIQIWM